MLQDTEVIGFGVKQTTSYSEDGTTAVRIMFVPREVAKVALRELVLNHFDIEGTRCYHEYDCCGHWYHNGCIIVRRPNRSLVIYQRSYQNI